MFINSFKNILQFFIQRTKKRHKTELSTRWIFKPNIIKNCQGKNHWLWICHWTDFYFNYVFIIPKIYWKIIISLIFMGMNLVYDLVHTWVLTTMSRILESIYNVVQCASSPWTFFRWKPHFFVICALNPTLCTYYCCPSSSAILYTLLLTDIELYIFSSANPFIIRLCGLKSALIAMRSTVGHFESSMSSKGKIDYF